MADILVKNSNKTFFQFPSDVAYLLCTAFPEAFSIVERTAPAPVVMQARWSNSVSLSGFKYINVDCPKCNSSSRFEGNSEQLPQFEKALCVHAGQCPDGIKAAYGDGGLQLYGLKH